MILLISKIKAYLTRIDYQQKINKFKKLTLKVCQVF